MARPQAAVAAGTLPASPMVALRDVTRTFGGGATAVHALRGVSFTVPAGHLVALRGRSGSGKTTMLNIIGGLDMATSGTVRVAGRDVNGMTEHERLLLRRSTVAFIFQSFGLIPMLSAAENVGIPLRIAGTERRAREERIALLLSVVGLENRARQRPNELSGGEQQRVAIARALAGSPELLIADEPTGQLDSETGRQIMRLLLTVVRSEGITALVATHDAGLVDLADEVVTLEDGRSGPDPALIGSLPRRQAAGGHAAGGHAAGGHAGGQVEGGHAAGRQAPAGHQAPAPAARHRRSQPAPVSAWWKRRENR